MPDFQDIGGVGKAIQTKDYVIIFGASWQTFEDTLLFFQNEIEETTLTLETFALQKAVGVHMNRLGEDLSFRDGFLVRQDRIHRFNSETPDRPRLVHLLHFEAEGEIDAHRMLSDRIGKAGIAVVNPYNSAAANCDSKYRMYEVLKRSGVPTPETVFISRFNRKRGDVYREVARRIKRLYIMPDRGTEGRDCFFITNNGKITLPAILDREEDLVARAAVGNTRYQEENLVMRINATYDGSEYHADSGFCMAGGDVVSANRGARKIDINRVIRELSLEEDVIRRIKAVSSLAARAICQEGHPPLLLGIDLVLENGNYPYVLDINPRPVVVGSRIIGENRIGLGQHFWQGVCRL